MLSCSGDDKNLLEDPIIKEKEEIIPDFEVLEDIYNYA